MNDEELRQFTENMAELNRVLPSLVQGIALSSSMMNEQASKGNAFSTTMKANSQELDKYLKTQQKLNPVQEAQLQAQQQLAKETQNLANAMKSSVVAAKSMGDALLSSEKNLTKFSKGIETAGDAAFQLSKNFGLVGAAVGLAIKGITSMANAALQQTDNMMAAKDSLAEFGAGASLSAESIREFGKSAGYTRDELAKWTKVTKSLGTEIIGLSTTVGGGVKEFANLTAITNKQYENYRKMGVSQEQLTQNQADYVRLQVMSGRVITEQMKRDGSLKAATLEYTNNLMALSNITGLSVEEQKKVQQQAASHWQFNVKMIELENKKQAAIARNDDKAAASIEAEIKAKKQMMEEAELVSRQTGDAQHAAATASLLATGAITESSKSLLFTNKQALEQAKKTERGEFVQGSFMQGTANTIKESVNNFGTLALTANEEFGKLTGMTGAGTAQFANTYGGPGKDVAKLIAEEKAKTEAAARTGTGAQVSATEKTVAAMDTAGRKTREVFDDIVKAGNPLTSGFNALTVATTALVAAAGLATVALAALAAKSKIGDIMDDFDVSGPGKKGRGRGSKGKSRSNKRAPNVATARRSGKALSSAGKLLAGAGRFAGPAAGVIAAGTGAYSAYSDYNDIDDQVKAGELSKDQGTVKKGEAVGSGVGSGLGGLGGAAAGAALGTMIFPVVGTAIGAALGGALGAWGGGAAGGAAGGAIGKSMIKPAQQKAAEDQAQKAEKEQLDADKRTNDALKELTKISKKGFEDLISATDDLGIIMSGKADDKSLERILSRYKLISGKTGSASSGGATSAGGGGAGSPYGGGAPQLDSSGRMTASSDPRALGVEPAGSEKQLLDFIGKHESNGNYNILVGGGKADLTNMSIKEVLALQKTMISSGKESTAVGKYQIIKGTLEGLLKESGLSPDTKFDEATQDKLGLLLLKRRGLDKYTSGKIDANAFADNLAKEWASLPTQSGKSYYAGVGSNKSGTSRNDFMSSLPKAQANSGGLFEGSATGYGVTLHNREAVVPLPDPNSTITVNSPNEPSKSPLSTVLAGTSPTGTSMDSLVGLTSEMIDMLSVKLDDMIDRLSVANDLQDQLLRYSKA